MKRMAETGSKDPDNEKLTKDMCNFKVYYSDIEFANNCIQVSSDTFKTTYLSIQTFNKIATSNTFFNEDIERWLNNIMRKSTLISLVGEKTRFQFFKRVFEGISKLENKIKNESN